MEEGKGAELRKQTRVPILFISARQADDIHKLPQIFPRI